MRIWQAMTAAIIAVGGMTAGCSPSPPKPAPVRAAVALPVPPRTLVGAGSCTSSGCHAAPVDGHAPWQSAFTVWSTRDPHARAHEALRGPLAAEIITALAARDPGHLQRPAYENMACIGCHATARGPMAGEGVSCESCHGPAGRWLVAHTEQGWTTHGNDLAMIDLADPFVCASTCANCHVGGPPTPDGAIREVTHDLIAAGHPRLAFELRGYKRAEPPHWRDRFAAVEGDTAPGPVDEWAHGRLGILSNFLRQVASQSQAAATRDRGLTAGVWPELTAFDCHGCHRPAWLAAAPRPSGLRAPVPPGSPRLEPMYWTHLDAILPPEACGPLSQAAIAIDRQWTAIPDSAVLAAAIHAIEEARPRLHEHLATRSAGDMARQIALGTDATSWAEAVSALGGLQALADSEAAAGRLADEREVRLRLASLHRLLEFPIESVNGNTERFSSPRGYDAEAVAAYLRSIAAALEARGEIRLP